MNEKLSQAKTFLVENVTDDLLKKAGLTVAILFGVIVAQLLLGAVVTVVNSIPIVNDLLMLVGLYTFGKFAINNLLTAEKRTETVEKVKGYYTELTV